MIAERTRLCFAGGNRANGPERTRVSLHTDSPLPRLERRSGCVLNQPTHTLLNGAIRADKYDVAINA